MNDGVMFLLVGGGIAIAITLAEKIYSRTVKGYPVSFLEIGSPRFRKTPFSGGAASIRLPSSYTVHPQNDGSLSVAREMTPGAAMFIVGNFVQSEGVTEDDPAFAFIEAWKEERDGSMTVESERTIGHAAWTVDEPGNRVHCHQWLIGQGSFITSVAIEVCETKSRKYAIKSWLGEMEKLVRTVEINTCRAHMLTDEGEVPYYVTPDALRVKQPKPADREFIETWKREGDAILSRYFNRETVAQPEAEQLDALATLLRTEARSEETARNITNVLGVLFADLCERQLEMEWGIVEPHGQRQLVVWQRQSGFALFPFQVANGVLANESMTFQCEAMAATHHAQAAVA